MNNSLDRLKTLIIEVNTTIDFANTEERLLQTIEEIRNDTSLLPLQKEPAIIEGLKALEKLRARLTNSTELEIALKNFRRVLDTSNEVEIKNICDWFFKVAYSGVSISSQMEDNFRPILARHSPNAGSNKDYLDKSCRRYERFASEGPDLKLSRDNLEGIKIASRVYILPTGFAEQMQQRAQLALAKVAERQRLAPIELAKEVTEFCKNLIDPAYEKHKMDKNHFLQQEDSWLLNIYLTRTIEYIEQNNLEDDDTSELIDLLNRLRSKFQVVRFRSSAVIFAKLTQKIESLREKSARSINFAELKRDVKAVQEEIKECQNGKKGVNRMERYHVDTAFSMIGQVFTSLNSRQHSKEELDLEIKRFESEVTEMHRSTTPPSARSIQRIQRYAHKDSLLGKWISSCYPQPSDEREKIVLRMNNILQLCQEMWARMEATQEQRIQEFDNQCSALKNTISSSLEFRDIWSEIKELEQSVEDFPDRTRQQLLSSIKGLKEQIKQRVNNRDAFLQYVGDLESSIETAHRRIKGFIDFDDLNERARLANRWAESHFFVQRDKDELQRRTKRIFKEIHIVKARQERERYARAEKAKEVYEDLLNEINTCTAEATRSPGKPQSWQLLLDVDKRVREAHHILNDDQRKQVKNAVDLGFNKVKQLRSKFAEEASVIYASYLDQLNNILAELEEDVSRDSAFEAIETVKPIRAKFRNETKLLRVHKDDINNLITTISRTIDEVFAEVQAKASQEYDRIQADIEKLEDLIRGIANASSLDSAINYHKQLSTLISQSNLSIAQRKECRAEMDRLWTDIFERMRVVRANRFSATSLEDTISRLEREGYLLFINAVPNIR